MINYYETLGVEPSASAEEIKSAYRALAKRLHPDVPGGDPVKFARATEAYEVLSEAGQRKSFDDAMRAHKLRREERLQPKRPHTGGNWSPPPPGSPFAARPRGPTGAEDPPGTGAGFAPEADPGPPITRLMSLNIPPSGRFLLEGLNGEFIIQPTAPNDLWETTRRKYAGEDPAALARRVVQIRVHGPRDLVQQLKAVPTEFGVQLQGVAKEQFLGGRDEDASSFLNPRVFQMEQMLSQSVKVTATVPAGAAVYLYDLTGKITVGDVHSELVANLDERTVLRAGAMRAVNLNMNGRARAHLAQMEGELDAIMFGQTQLLVEGHATRMRVVLEHEAHLESKALVDWLQATVGGRGYLNMKAPVDRAHCEVRAAGYARLVKVVSAIQSSRTGSGGLDVIEGPPPQSIFGNVQAGPPPGFPGGPPLKGPPAKPKVPRVNPMGAPPGGTPGAPRSHPLSGAVGRGAGNPTGVPPGFNPMSTSPGGGAAKPGRGGFNFGMTPEPASDEAATKRPGKGVRNGMF